MNSRLTHENFYLNVTQGAQRYGVSTATIWRWARNGELPKGVKIGPNATRWRMVDITRHEETFQTGLIFAPLFVPDFEMSNNRAPCFSMVA